MESGGLRRGGGTLLPVVGALLLLLVSHHSADAAPIGVDALTSAAEAEYHQSDLGESAEVSAETLAAEDEEVGEMSDYAATKKKLEGEIKKVEDDLKKRKVAAKKHFDDQMKKASATFAKLYAPKKKGAPPLLDSPLGTDGQSGVSSMAQWAYATQVEALTKIAHKKIAKYHKELDENRFRHFSTAVCKEVLKSKVPAIGDIAFKMKREKIEKQLKDQKIALAHKIAFDRADMGHKIASFKLWERDSSWAADGGLTGPDPDTVHMMTEGQSHKLGASRVGELVQAAHWAFARQKAHAIEFYDRNVKELHKQLKKVTEAHDLTLCRTGRKPENPQLKYELDKAKKDLQKQLQNMPAEAQEKAKDAEKKVEADDKKAAGAAPAPPPAREQDLGEDMNPGDLGESMTSSAETVGEATVEFHKLIDASGGNPTIAERAKMFKDFMENAQLEQQAIVRENEGLEDDDQ